MNRLSTIWKCKALAVLVGSSFLRVASAQVTGAPPPAEKLIVATAAPVSVAAGGNAAVTVKLAIESGWHVNANPPARDYNIPTTVKLAVGPGLAPGKAHYPAGKKEKFEFDDAPLLVYDGAVEVTLPLVAAADAHSQTLEGSVEFQACNDQLCLTPVSVPFTVAVTVTAAGPGHEGQAAGGAPIESTLAAAPETSRAIRSSFDSAPPPGSSAAARNKLEAALAHGGLVSILALFVGGLLLNLTPCVFPMLGVTVSIFGARRKEPVPKVIATALLYVLGICITYTSLGVVAALTGHLFGSALQLVWVNLILGGLMLVLSLGMFGVYEMQPPLWLMDRLGGAQATSMAGAFVSGLGVGIIAAPCVGPFVVAVLALIAQRGDVGFGLSTMFTLSLGLGFPYLFLATFSNLLQMLPRSGEWMVWVKHALGTLLASIGVFYLVLALAPDKAPWVLPAALALGGLWLGFVDKSSGPKGAFRTFATVVGGIALFAGVFIGGSMFRVAQRTLSFRAYDAAAVKASVASGRPVMMDFSADWCLPCHEMELRTFTDPRVVAAARSFDRYKVDLTKYDSPEAQALRKQYAISGVPIVVFLDGGGNEIAEARVDGFLGPEGFLERLKVGGSAAR